jgi:PAS domain S-box-containing protein
MLLSEKILPSLLIRQSAMIYIIDGHPYTLFSIGVDEDQIPTSPEIVNIFSKSADKQSEFTIRTDYYAWINLTLPLQIDQKTIGLWLLGKKDPDDLYNSEEISILTSIANQTAIALAKIQHKEQLNALLQENIYRAEEERKKLARDLHDDILNGLVVLGMTLDENQVSLIFEKQFSFLTNRIRRMITGLRPPSLDQGLWFALKEKSDELQLHTNGEILIDFDVPFSETRYHHNIEGQIFRIVQQACDNALFHAQAKNIRLKGELTPDMIIINVEDDGKGFILDDQHQDKKEDQNSEIKHYGLAIMRERAELIGADLSIQSVLGQGTRIQLALKSIIYQKDEHQARIKAEKALHEREKSYRELLTTASYGILINNESDRMIFANEQAARISGYSILELLNLTIEDLATSDEYQKIKAFRQNKKEEAKYSNPLFETHLQKKSGEIIPIEMTVTQTIWEGKRVGMAFFADIREKKRIENALKQSEENTYKIFDNAIDGIVLVDASGKHLYVNKRFAEMVDYSVSELLKKSMKDIVHDESMEELSSRLKDRFSGSNPTMPFEIKIKKKDGTVLPIIGISTKIKWQGKDAVMGFMRDLSIQRQAEEELRQTENKFRILIENARDGILVADQSGKYIYSNSRAAEIFGYESNELPNLSYPDIIHPDHIGEIEKEIFSTKEFESIPIHRESKIITKSGIILTVEYSAFPTIWEGKRGFLFIFRDISAIINAQENLRISEEKFKAIVDNANDGILVANPNGKHIYANTRASEITGYPIDELLKTTINDLAHPEEFPAIKERFNARLAGQLTPRQYSTRILTKEGISKDIEITAARTSWNNHPAIIVIIRDPSERN